jgi:hypothetical protein
VEGKPKRKTKAAATGKPPPLSSSPPTEDETRSLFRALGCPETLLEQIAIGFYLDIKKWKWKVGREPIRIGEWPDLCRGEWLKKKWIDDKRKADQTRYGGATDEEVSAQWDGAKKLN